MSDKEILKKLSELHEVAIKAIKEYNILAKNNNQNTRMAYATASSYANEHDEDEDGNKINTDFEKVVNDSWGENVGISITSPEAEMWFPSSICQ